MTSSKYEGITPHELKNRILSSFPEDGGNGNQYIELVDDDNIERHGLVSCWEPIQFRSVPAIKTHIDHPYKLVGVLFAKPYEPLAKEQIVEHLESFYYRTGDLLDLICVGYGTSWPENYFGSKEPVTKVNHENWFFSNKAFSDIVNDFMGSTTWKYSGETELLLFPAEKIDNDEICLHVQSSLIFKLNDMYKYKIFSSVSSFIEILRSSVESNSEKYPTCDFSNEQLIMQFKSSLRDWIISYFKTAKLAQETINKIKTFIVTDISKKEIKN